MVTWYVLCDPTLKGELLVQWRNQWKQWGSKFRYWNGESLMRSKYGFGQWGYIKTTRDYSGDYPGVHLMGWEYHDIWGTPNMWNILKTSRNPLIWKYFTLRDWHTALFIRWRMLMCLYFYEIRVLHWKTSVLENKLKWQQFIKE